jgi:triosephosphate isomerase (TIM)
VRAGLVGVSLKAHLGVAGSTAWLADVAHQLARPAVPVFVCPPFPMLATAVELLAGTPIAVGSQDVSAFTAGPHTGDVPASMIADLGARYGEVGHAERRKDHGESDAIVAAKILRCLEADITPVICVGEDRPLPVDAAIAFTCAQLDRRLALRPAGSSVVVAYEPEWAIGAEQAADPQRISAVVAAIRDLARAGGVNVEVLYGGAAAEGVFSAVCDAAPMADGRPDGLFLGRSALDVGRLVAIVAEVAARCADDD